MMPHLTITWPSHVYEAVVVTTSRWAGSSTRLRLLDDAASPLPVATLPGAGAPRAPRAYNTGPGSRSTGCWCIGWSTGWRREGRCWQGTEDSEAQVIDRSPHLFLQFDGEFQKFRVISSSLFVLKCLELMSIWHGNYLGENGWGSCLVRVPFAEEDDNGQGWSQDGLNQHLSIFTPVIVCLP